MEIRWTTEGTNRGASGISCHMASGFEKYESGMVNGGFSISSKGAFKKHFKADSALTLI